MPFTLIELPAAGTTEPTEDVELTPVRLISRTNFFKSEKEIEEIEPNFDLLKQLPGQGLIVSSLGEKYDFVSRYFCPKFGINEDPVTGSAHTTLIPYWSDKLNKKELRAKQISKRGGELFCINEESRVLIGGNATLYMKGEIEIN